MALLMSPADPPDNYDATAVELASRASHLSLVPTPGAGHSLDGHPTSISSVPPAVTPAVPSIQPRQLDPAAYYLATDAQPPNMGYDERPTTSTENHAAGEQAVTSAAPMAEPLFQTGLTYANRDDMDFAAGRVEEGSRFIAGHSSYASLCGLPNELVLHILGYLDVCDLLSTSRTSHHLRQLSQAPILHIMRLRRTRATLPPLLISPPRPSLADLIARSIFLTHTTVVSRKLARSLVSIRLSRRLAVRPSLETLVERCVLPPECVPGPDGAGKLAPALVAKKRAVERERVKDGLRRWIGAVWRGEVRERSEGVRQWEERCGVGRVWRLRKFWERVGRGEVAGDLG